MIAREGQELGIFMRSANYRNNVLIRLPLYIFTPPWLQHITSVRQKDFLQCLQRLAKKEVKTINLILFTQILDAWDKNGVEAASTQNQLGEIWMALQAADVFQLKYGDFLKYENDKRGGRKSLDKNEIHKILGSGW